MRQSITPSIDQYLSAIARRVKALDGVRDCRAELRQRQYRAHLTVTPEATGFNAASDELKASINALRGEFSAAFPDYGIGVVWKMRSLTRIKKVERTVISGGYVVQQLECGHNVKGERIRCKRQCQECAHAEIEAERAAGKGES